MKTPMVSSATSFQRLQTSLQSPMPRLPRSNVYSTQDPANPSASVHRKRFFTPSLTLKFLCAGYLNRGWEKRESAVVTFILSIRVSFYLDSSSSEGPPDG